MTSDHGNDEGLNWREVLECMTRAATAKAMPGTTHDAPAATFRRARQQLAIIDTAVPR